MKNSWKDALWAFGLPVLILGTPFVLFLVGFLGLSEILSIDRFSTKKAPGFSETKFAAAKIGMRSNEVVALLGLPMMQSPKWVPPEAKEWTGVEEWSYTSPNEIVNGMGCWNFRGLMLSNGIVVDIKKHIVMHH